MEKYKEWLHSGESLSKIVLERFLKEQYERGIYNSISANIFDFNHKSQNLFQNVGFQGIGERYETYYAYGRLNNSYFYEMNQSGYQKKLR